MEVNGAATAVYYDHTDHLGGSSVLTNATGSREQLLDYFPFGGIRLNEKLSTFEEQRKFTGQEYDKDTNLHYYGQRYYNQDVGRFTSQDPVFLAVGSEQSLQQLSGLKHNQYLADPQGFNSYSYTRNNPLRYVDEQGEWIETVVDLVSLGLSMRDFNQEPSLANAGWVGLDLAGSVLPLPAIFGYVRHGDTVLKLSSYFNKVSDRAGVGIGNLMSLYAKNAGFKMTRAGWSAGEAGDSLGNLVGHFALHGDEVGAKSVQEYYNKANDFVQGKGYTNSFSEGGDTVFYNAGTKLRAITSSQGEIKTFGQVSNENIIENYQKRIQKNQ